jgi:molybdopterin adenylyltransferase
MEFTAPGSYSRLKKKEIDLTDPIRCAIITVSDRSATGVRPDLSGPALVRRVTSLGWTIESTHLVSDDFSEIRLLLLDLCQKDQVDIILTTGGTGFSPRDITPEATLAVIERNAAGLAETMRSESLKINPHAMLSRAVTGICKNTLIINLPGNPNAAIENLEVILPVIPHAVSLLRSSPDSESGHQIKPRG